MSIKNIVWGTMAVGILLVGVSAMAKDGVGSDLNVLRASRTPKPSATPLNLSCIAAAVSVRETTLGNAVATNSAAIQNAYSARASALATAYSKTSAADIRSGIKLAWSSFNTSIKNAGKDWRTAQQGAWATFKTAAKACGSAQSSVSDGDNMGHEVSGN